MEQDSEKPFEPPSCFNETAAPLAPLLFPPPHDANRVYSDEQALDKGPLKRTGLVYVRTKSPFMLQREFGHLNLATGDQWQISGVLRLRSCSVVVSMEQDTSASDGKGEAFCGYGLRRGV